MQNAAIGLRAKTGRAIAVVLGGSINSPGFVWRGELNLVDPTVPETAEPYHIVMNLPWSEACVAVPKLATLIAERAVIEIRRVIGEIKAQNVLISGAGIVGSAPRNLERIGSVHIRAHAAEGVLFREVLERGAKANGLQNCAFVEHDLKEQASALLNGAEHLNSGMKQLGTVAGPPWRADEKLAAMAALLALRGCR